MLLVNGHQTIVLIGIPINTLKRGPGNAELFSVLKTNKDPPKSATANMEASELKEMPQLVIEKRDWVYVFF